MPSRHMPARHTPSNPTPSDPEQHGGTLAGGGSPYGYCHLVGPLLRDRRARRSADQHVVAWIAEFQRSMSRRLRGTASFDVLDDVIGREVLKAIEHFGHISEHWTPGRYARHRAAGARAVVDLLRTDAAQRGEGARRTRTVAALDGAIASVLGGDDELTLHDVYGTDDQGFFTVETRDLLAGALLGLTARQRQVVYLVDGVGHAVTDAAERLGITRETASRALSVARRRLCIALDA